MRIKRLLLSVLLLPGFLFMTLVSSAQDEALPPAPQARPHAPLVNTNAIKFEFFAPLGGKFVMGYEKLVKEGLSIELKLGVVGIGVGTALNNQKNGIFFKGGPKLMLGQDFTFDGMRNVHPLRGSYFKPEIIYSDFTREESGLFNSSSSTERVGYQAYAFVLNFGRQVVLMKVLTFDYYFGAGYGYVVKRGRSLSSLNDLSIGNPNMYSHLFLGNRFPLALTSGFTLGVAF